MTNNDILRRLRYTFDFGDDKMIALFALENCTVSRAEVSDWLKKEDHPEHAVLNDLYLATFLNGFITDQRGRKDGKEVPAEKRLNNNLILRKLKIALNLKAEDIIEILASVDMKVSKPMLSALFRRPGQKHYKDCQDQLLRNFLHGLQLKYRDDAE